MLEIKFTKLSENAELPTYATSGSAAADLRYSGNEDIIIPSGEGTLVPTGIAISLPSADYAAIVCARSGLASKYGICLSNGIGVIDSDYRGEIKVALRNLGKESFTVHGGDRVAQLMIIPVTQAIFKECESLDDTERGKGGFGSTGIG